jgi:hypothetical protein
VDQHALVHAGVEQEVMREPQGQHIASGQRDEHLRAGEEIVRSIGGARNELPELGERSREPLERETSKLANLEREVFRAHLGERGFGIARN